MRAGHFDGISDWTFRLIFERACTSIPEESFIGISEVDYARSATPTDLRFHTHARRTAIRETHHGIVAGSATDVAVRGEPWIEEQLAAQFDLCRG